MHPHSILLTPNYSGLFYHAHDAPPLAIGRRPRSRARGHRAVCQNRRPSRLVRRSAAAEPVVGVRRLEPHFLLSHLCPSANSIVHRGVCGYHARRTLSASHVDELDFALKMAMRSGAIEWDGEIPMAVGRDVFPLREDGMGGLLRGACGDLSLPPPFFAREHSPRNSPPHGRSRPHLQASPSPTDPPRATSRSPLSTLTRCATLTNQLLPVAGLAEELEDGTGATMLQARAVGQRRTAAERGEG